MSSEARPGSERAKQKDMLSMRIDALAVGLESVSQDLGVAERITGSSQEWSLDIRFSALSSSDDESPLFNQPVAISTRLLDADTTTQPVLLGYDLSSENGHWSISEVLVQAGYPDGKLYKSILAESHVAQLESIVLSLTDIMVKHASSDTLRRPRQRFTSLIKSMLRSTQMQYVEPDSVRHITLPSNEIVADFLAGPSADLHRNLEIALDEHECSHYLDVRLESAVGTCDISKDPQGNIVQVTYYPRVEMGADTSYQRKFALTRANGEFVFVESLAAVDASEPLEYQVGEPDALNFGVACDIMVALDDAQPVFGE